MQGNGNRVAVHDDPAKLILEQIGELGYIVQVGAGFVHAVDSQTGEIYRVAHEPGSHYQAVCELAQLVGLELEDG